MEYRKLGRSGLKVSEVALGGWETYGINQDASKMVGEIVRAAYDAPFPDETYKAGPRAMPSLVPTAPDDPATTANRAAWEELARWDKPFLVAFSDSDPITGAMAPVLMKTIPGAQGLDHPVIAGAGHFLQEDAGEELGRVIADFVTMR